MIRKPRLTKKHLEKIQQNNKHFNVDELIYMTNEILRQIVNSVKYNIPSSRALMSNTYTINTLIQYNPETQTHLLEIYSLPTNTTDTLYFFLHGIDNSSIVESMYKSIKMSDNDLPDVDTIIDILLSQDDVCNYINKQSVYDEYYEEETVKEMRALRYGYSY